ncbi:uncharacterized protein LOC141701756 [Apium graveolens]|uniref:uncharacterized protein LOC141701756 n=1 Tax=Apium graveolens TaxID=4045 RepID=UPI003D7975CE
MAKFIRLAGFAGTVAGTAAQQTDKFKWGLKSYLSGSIISFKFDNVAEVADATKDVEKERINFRTSSSNSGSKRTRDDQGFAQGRQWYGVTISGTLIVGRRDAYVLFDTGSTHSVVSLSFVYHLCIVPSLLYPHMSIATPMGNYVIISDAYRECLIVVGDRNYKVNLLPMEMHDFEIILGMDWLSEHRATIDCQGKMAIFGDADKPEFVYQGSQPKGKVKLISALKASKLLSKGCDGYLAFVKDTSNDEPRIEDYPVVMENEDVSPMSYQAPYRMTPLELQELKEQLQELLDRGFIKPSVSLWGAPVLFVKKKDGSMRLCIDYMELN